MKRLIASLLLALCLVYACFVPGHHFDEHAVLKLVAQEGRGGTGFVVTAPSGKKYILTNRHMCEHGATNLEKFYNRLVPLRIIEVAQHTDLCLLESVPSLPSLELAYHPPGIGDELDVWGYGMLMPLTHTHGLFIGEISDGPVWDQFMFSTAYTTVPVLPGNSGSPVLDVDGRVVGVVFASGESIDNRALIIPWEDVKAFLAPY